MKETLDLYELILDPLEDDEVFALSLVSQPAILRNFMYFNKDGKREPIKFQSVDEEQRLIVGPILIPDMHILRSDEDGKPYNVFFSKETVKEAAQKYIRDGHSNDITIEHRKSVKDISLVESWIVDSTQYDKSKMYNMSVPVGTWMGVFKVNNPTIWNDYVKTGEVKGISLEGMFTHNKISLSADWMNKPIEELSEVQSQILLDTLKILLEDSYQDYGQEISNNAKRGIDLNEANGNKCATQTGKVRAQQLANGEPLSVDTIQRMYSFLSRAETYYDETDTKACGTISYLLWGGKSALSWSRNKLRELGLVEAEAQPSVGSSYPGEVASGSISPSLIK